MDNFILSVAGNKVTFSVEKGKVKNARGLLQQFDGKKVEKMFEYLEENFTEIDYRITKVK